LNSNWHFYIFNFS